jgi:hypothetical protein
VQPRASRLQPPLILEGQRGSHLDSRIRRPVRRWSLSSTSLSSALSHRRCCRSSSGACFAGADSGPPATRFAGPWTRRGAASCRRWPSRTPSSEPFARRPATRVGRSGIPRSAGAVAAAEGRRPPTRPEMSRFRVTHARHPHSKAGAAPRGRPPSR